MKRRPRKPNTPDDDWYDYEDIDPEEYDIIDYQEVSTAQRTFFELMLMNHILGAFEDEVNATLSFWTSDEAMEFHMEHGERLTEFFETSGINDKWQDIIDERARTGADISDEIYKYARELNMPGLFEFNEREISVMNKLADYNYELIRNVTEDQVRGIRQCMLQDYVEGRNPRRTSLLDELQNIQLQPINGWTPEQRAVVIARTEVARAINTATLEQYMADGVKWVTLINGGDPCAECEAMAMDGRLIRIEDAGDEPCIHPNCCCTWAATTYDMEDIGDDVMTRPIPPNLETEEET